VQHSLRHCGLLVPLHACGDAARAQMPVLTGEQTARRLRAAGYTGVIIGITGDPVGSPERANFASAGLNACVDKDTHGTKYVMRVIASYSNEHSSGPDARFTDAPSPSSSDNETSPA